MTPHAPPARYRIAEYRAQLDLASRVIDGLRELLDDLDARQRQYDQSPLVSVREAARRMGKSDAYLRALLKRDPVLSDHALVGGDGEVQVKWWVLESWLRGEPPWVGR